MVDNASNCTESRAAYCLKHDDRSRLKGKADLNELYWYVVACETGEELGSLAESGFHSGDTEHLSLEEGTK